MGARGAGRGLAERAEDGLGLLLEELGGDEEEEEGDELGLVVGKMDEGADEEAVVAARLAGAVDFQHRRLVGREDRGPADVREADGRVPGVDELDEARVRVLRVDLADEDAPGVGRDAERVVDGPEERALGVLDRGPVGADVAAVEPVAVDDDQRRVVGRLVDVLGRQLDRPLLLGRLGRPAAALLAREERLPVLALDERRDERPRRVGDGLCPGNPFNFTST